MEPIYIWNLLGGISNSIAHVENVDSYVYKSIVEIKKLIQKRIKQKIKERIFKVHCNSIMSSHMATPTLVCK